MSRRTLAEFLTELRHSRKWSLRDLEIRSGLNNAYLSQLETGKTKNPTIGTIAKLSRAYGITPMDFFHTKEIEDIYLNYMENRTKIQ